MIQKKKSWLNVKREQGEKETTEKRKISDHVHMPESEGEYVFSSSDDPEREHDDKKKEGRGEEGGGVRIFLRRLWRRPAGLLSPATLP